MSGPSAWSDVARAQVKKAQLNLVLLFRLASDPIARYCSGFGDFAAPADIWDAEPSTYRGAGELISLPTLQMLINGRADRVEFTLSGVGDEAVRLAMTETSQVLDAHLALGVCVLDAKHQRISPVAWRWDGYADALRPGGKGDSRTLVLSAASPFARRRRPHIALYTDAQQRQRSASDDFCSNVASLSAGKTRRFQPRE